LAEDESELERAIRRVISRILADPISTELLKRMKAYGSAEKFLVWWLQGVQIVMHTRNRLTIARSPTASNSMHLMRRRNMARAIMEEAARRLRDAGEAQYVLPPPPNNPPLKAEALPDT
jgi:hypothetical protein